jgi:hypothetical protein
MDISELPDTGASIPTVEELLGDDFEEEDIEEDDDPAELYCGTRGGVKIDLRNPNPDSFHPGHTARTLSNIYRYSGNHGKYTVAQHAVLVSIAIEAMGGTPSDQFAGLHHDDEEAVTSDIPDPVKRAVREIGDALDQVIAKIRCAIEAKYLIDIRSAMVTRGDKTVYANEVIKYIPSESKAMYIPFPTPELILPYAMMTPWPEEEAYARYMDRHMQLQEEHMKFWAKRSHKLGNKA